MTRPDAFTHDLPGYDAAFARESRALLIDRLRLTLRVGMALYGVFWGLDWLAAFEHRWDFLFIRLVVVTAGVLTIAAAGTATGQRAIEVLSVGILVVASQGISMMTLHMGGFESDYFAGNMLVLFFVGLFMPWSFRSTLAFCALVSAGYFLPNLFVYGPSHKAGSALFFLAATSAFTCLSTVGSERTRRRDLAMRLRLESANRHLTKLDEAKTRFFANVSHELRTPLMLILGPLEALLGSPDAANARALLETIYANANRLLRQVNMLLDLAKLDVGRLRCRPAMARLGEILARLVTAAQPFAQRRGVVLRAEGLDELPASELDPEQIETVAANLVSNALKFTPPGGEVVVRASYTAHDACFEVADTGPGIPADQLEAIFDRFHQVEQGDDHKPEGTGLGLAMVEELVLLHHGTVAVTSTPGRGATFRVTLPRVAVLESKRHGLKRRREDQTLQSYRDALVERRFAEDARRLLPFADLETARLQATAAPVATAPPTAPRVLVVEDDGDLRTFLENVLRSRYRVDTAGDGVEGLHKARQLGPDLILADIVMPRMTGYELCRQLKADALTATTPIVLLTAKAGADAVVEGLHVGADDYLTKPFDLRELDARIAAHLRTHALERKLHERESRLAVIGQHASSVVHDLRSPLQAIMSYSEFAMSVLPPEMYGDVRGDLDLVLAAVQRADTMLDQIVEFAKSGSVELRFEEVELSKLVGLVERDFRRTLDDAGIRLQIESSAAGGLWTRGDPVQLRRVLENLLRNARDALAERRTDEAKPAIWVRLSGEADAAVMRVSDNGPGLPSELGSSLFEPFMTARKKGGAGLGLAVVANLVKAHGGEVTAEAHGAEGGATFVVRLPACRECPSGIVRRPSPSPS